MDQDISKARYDACQQDEVVDHILDFDHLPRTRSNSSLDHIQPPLIACSSPNDNLDRPWSEAEKTFPLGYGCYDHGN